MLALEEGSILMCQISRAILIRFNSKTRLQMFMFLYGRYVCVPPKGTNMGVCIQIWLTRLRITRERKTAQTWLLARLFIYPSSIVSQILDLIHWKLKQFLDGAKETSRQRQSIIVVQGDIVKDMCMIKPYKLLRNFLRLQFFLCSLTNHPWIMKDGAVKRAMTSNENKEDN